MTIKVSPPPLQVPSTFLSDKQTSAFFNGLMNTVYQLWSAVYNMQTTAKVKTTDATTTALVRSSVVEGTTAMFVCRVVARRTGGSAGTAGDSAFYTLTGAYKNVGGVLTGVGSAAIVAGEDQPAWDVGFTTSGTEAIVIVTGAANNDITWQGEVSVLTAGA